MGYLDEVEFNTNPDPRCPCVQGLLAFQNDIQQDSLAQRRVEVAIVTFGNGGVQTMQDFITAGRFEAPMLVAGGNTPMGEAIHRGLDMLRERKAQYKANGIAYYRPWIFMITDGAPTDEWQTAAQRIKAEERTKAFAFFAVGVAGANMQILSQITAPERPPVKLQELKFADLFVWLSRSQQRVSASKIGEQTALPSVSGWAMV